MTGILSTGTSALLAFQRALSTVSNNVANVNTEGYSRQRVELTNRPPQGAGFGFLGSGVQVDSVRRITDQFNYLRQLDSSAELGRLSEFSLLAGRLDTSFTDVGTSLAKPWSDFFDAAQALSSNPASSAAREAYLSAAQTVTTRLRYLDSQVVSVEREVNQRMIGTAEEASRLVGAIANLNGEIVRLQSAAAGNPANDLLDRRELLIKQLAGLIGVTTAEQDDGAINIFTQGGQALVVGNQSVGLSTAIDPFRADRVNLVLVVNGIQTRIPDSALGGELGALVQFRTNVLDPTDRSIGQIASTLAYTVNEINSQGVDLLGQRGGDIFNQPTMGIRPGRTNTGAATLTASISDISAYTGADVELRFDGVSWSARDNVTGSAIPMTGSGTPADPFIVEGVAIEVGGAPNAGDSFLVQTAAGAAGQISVALTDPRGIAAAAPLQISRDLDNLSAVRGQITVVDLDNPNFFDPVDIEFIDANNFLINGFGPVAYNPGDVIAANGWEMRLDGPPMAGDVFRLRATPAGSSDNSNALRLAQLDDSRLLLGGVNSLNDLLRQTTVRIGAAAAGAERALEAQQVVDQQLALTRESVSGVNLDEEAANLLKFQQAYQAAAQVISAADTIFQSLLQAVRR
ncbi:MAG TPA: flagellar hook-associated protein FlgK [Vicinamibacterales bacterium]|nr:flagellar hook-associated protein FlgK [Vicinamibacterales bacterium]